jgi:hypothetical protein
MNKPSTTRTGKAGKAGKSGSSPGAPQGGARRKATAAKRASSGRNQAPPQVDSDIRHAMIAQAAYFRAERRGFEDGSQLDDWFEAEREISRILDE